MPYFALYHKLIAVYFKASNYALLIMQHSLRGFSFHYKLLPLFSLQDIDNYKTKAMLQAHHPFPYIQYGACKKSSCPRTT